MVHSQLTQLIFSFYREDPIELQQLHHLDNCKVFRRWGTLHIKCQNLATAEAIASTYTVLREPIAQLNLAQKIKISVNRTWFLALPVHSSQQSRRSAHQFRL